MSRDRLRLLHIRDAIQRIRSYVSDEDDFRRQPVIQDAVIRNLEVIGEAVKALSDEIKNLRAEVAWRQIGGMRDRLIHHYFAVDLDLIWDVVCGPELQELSAAVVELLGQNGDDVDG